MGIRFLGTPLEQFDQLCREEEKVTITVSCFKTEEIGYPRTDVDNIGTTIELEDTLTARQIKSSKDIFQFVDEYDNDDYKGLRRLIEKTQQRLVN